MIEYTPGRLGNMGESRRGVLSGRPARHKPELLLGDLADKTNFLFIESKVPVEKSNKSGTFLTLNNIS